MDAMAMISTGAPGNSATIPRIENSAATDAWPIAAT
jgi:hypothetical protein